MKSYLAEHGAIMLITVALASLGAGVAVALPTGNTGFGEWGSPVSAETVPGTELNTSSNDGCPILSPDGLSLFMASNRPGSAGLDIWVARRSSTTANWDDPVRLPEPVNSAANDFCPSPVRGNRLFFVSTRGDPANADGDIYETRLGKDGWSEPRRLGGNINTSNQEWSPSYFEDEQGRPVLYFSRVIGGKHEVYASVNWGPAEKVVELSLNGTDAARPNVRRDGREIVFDTVRAPNQGGPDVWTASRPSTSAPWSSPVPIDIVNSAFGESRASLSWDGTIMLFGSARPAEGVPPTADIYVTRRARITGMADN